MMSQQSLSQQINQLERLLGVKLFDRDTRGTRLTDAGAWFVPEARAVLDRADAAFEAVAGVARGEIGRLRLAFLATTANYLLPPVVRAARERLPGLELTTEETTIAPLVEGLRKRRYDVAFTRPPLVDDLQTRTLYSEQVCAVLPEEHRLAGRAELALEELAGERWVLTPRSAWEPWHEAFDDTFRAAGFAPDVAHRDASVQGLLGLVAAGVGATRLARSASSLRRTGVVFVPLAGEFVSTEMVWASGSASPALQGMLDLVTEMAATTDLANAG
jgi:DNA-binding transcriptional LysR family regulator